MKKCLLFPLIAAGISDVYGQEMPNPARSSERRNDVMLSPIELIAAPALNLSYERLLINSPA